MVKQNFYTQFLREKNFKQTIPQVKVKDGEEITYEIANTALRRAAHFFSALQASDGHWPAESAGSLYFLPPFVSTLYLLVFIVSHIIDIMLLTPLIYIIRLYLKSNYSSGLRCANDQVYMWFALTKSRV